MKKAKGHVSFVYWRARDGNSECTGVVNVIKVRRQKDICMGKSRKDMCPLAIGVFSMSSKSGDKKTYVWTKGKRTCVLLAIGDQEREIQNAEGNFIKVQRQKKSDL